MFRVRTLFTGVAGAPYYSNLFFNGTISTDAQLAVDAVAAFWDGLQTALRSPMVAQVEPLCPVIDPATGAVTGVFLVDQPEQTTMTNVTQALPPATQMLANLRTGVYAAGREVRGKCFIPGWTEASNDNGGVPDEIVRTNVASQFTDLAEAADGMVVYSRARGIAVPITTVTISNQWAVLRSRRD